ITGETVDIPVQLSHVGPTVLSIEAEGLENEVTDANNRIVTSVEGIAESVNVLLISGTLNPSALPLRDIFKSDPASVPVHVSVLRVPAEDYDGTPERDYALIPFPRNLVGEVLPKFDLVIFDHYPHVNILPWPYLNSIAKYVWE